MKIVSFGELNPEIPFFKNNFDELGKLLKKKFKNMLLDLRVLQTANLGTGLYITGRNDKDRFINFNLREFPGCCSWAIAYMLNGNIDLKLEIAEFISNEATYSGLLIALSSEQLSLIPFVEERGYKELFKNKNKHSGNDVYLYIKEL